MWAQTFIGRDLCLWMLQQLGMLPGDLLVHFVEPPARTAQTLPNQGFLMTCPLHRPLAYVFEKILPLQGLGGGGGKISELCEPDSKDFRHHIPTVGRSSCDILNGAVDFLVSHTRRSVMDRGVILAPFGHLSTQSSNGGLYVRC